MPYGPVANIVKDNFSGDKVENIVIVLMAVFYNSLRFHLICLNLPPLKSVDLYGFRQLNENKSGCKRVNIISGLCNNLMEIMN